MMRLSRRTALMGLLAATFALPRAHARGLAGQRANILLIDASLAGADLMSAAELRTAGTTLIVRGDLVRQWRGGLKRELAAHAGPVTALVRWDKALLLSGLARESGIRSSSARLSRSVFKVELFV
jgi:hypothetical protein